MKQLALVLTSLLLAANTPPSDDGYRVRYREPAGRMSLTVSHDIEVRHDPPVEASRLFTFELALTSDPDAGAVSVRIDRATASNVAHGQKQRLGTRHLTGRSVSLAVSQDGRQMAAADPAEEPMIGLGPVVTEGYSVGAALADILPVLPEEAVAVGTTWTTERAIRSLEGWAWAAGELTSEHRVTAIDQRDAHTVLTVVTESEARLGPVDGGAAFSGDLKRTLNWTFDATNGQLLSMTLEQQTEGDSEVPQGEIHIQQLTRVELAPVS